jgi:copper chaperone CopZ
VCKNAIEGALRPLPGVAEADVDVAARAARVRYGPPATLDVLRDAIEAEGYEVAGG